MRFSCNVDPRDGLVVNDEFELRTDGGVDLEFLMDTSGARLDRALIRYSVWLNEEDVVRLQQHLSALLHTRRTEVEERIQVQQIPGPITSRLLKMFGKSSPAWNPGRPADVAPKKGKVPKGVDGKSLGGRKKK